MSATLPLILVVDDDPVIAHFLTTLLKQDNYSVVCAADGQQALRQAAYRIPDLVILDLLLPRLPGIAVCRELRSWFKNPILVVSGQGEERLVVEALDAGADGYVTKPFRPRELLARVRTSLRHRGSMTAPVLRAGDLEVDCFKHRVFRAGQQIRLTRIEFNTLTVLVKNANRVMTHKMLMDEIWGAVRGDYIPSLRVHISQIRKKIEPDPSAPRYILTEQGVGYRVAAP